MPCNYGNSRNEILPLFCLSLSPSPCFSSTYVDLPIIGSGDENDDNDELISPRSKIYYPSLNTQKVSLSIEIKIAKCALGIPLSSSNLSTVSFQNERYPNKEKALLHVGLKSNMKTRTPV